MKSKALQYIIETLLETEQLELCSADLELKTTKFIDKSVLFEVVTNLIKDGYIDFAISHDTSVFVIINPKKRTELLLLLSYDDKR